MEKMRIFLVQTAQGLTPSSGGYKANISLLRQLRNFGHEAAQICYGWEKEVEQFARKAAAKGVEPNVTKKVVNVVDPRGITHDLLVETFNDEDNIHNIVISGHPFNEAYPVSEFLYDNKSYLEGGEITARLDTLLRLFDQHIRIFRPTHVIFNDALTMQLTYDMIYEARNHPPYPPGWVDFRPLDFKRVAVIHTAEQLPFGPYCGKIFGHCTSPAVEDELLRGLDGVWAVSRAIQHYAWVHGRLQTTFMVHSTLSYLDKTTNDIPAPRNNINKFEVGMVNPCPHKGLQILIDVAKMMPHVKFVVWTSWGSQRDHVEQLRALPNMTVEPTTCNTDEIWDRIRILLAPSVWFEAWGMVVTEAQLRGIPVIASDAGGLVEAKLGLPFTIPVKLITGDKYPNGDYKVPEQDLEPWVSTIDRLMADDAEYQVLSSMTAEKTSEWLSSLDEHAHEEWLLDMTRPYPDFFGRLVL